MGSEPRRGDPPPGAADADARHPAGASAFNSGDLAVLVSELHRVRDTDDAEGQSAGEALTLAATAVRIVEAQLARAGDTGLAPSDLATARGSGCAGSAAGRAKPRDFASSPRTVGHDREQSSCA